MIRAIYRWPFELKLVAFFGLLAVLFALASKVRGDELPSTPAPAVQAIHPTFQAMIDATNAERRAHELASLAVDPRLQGLAEKWGQHMARVGQMYHSSYGVAENVAWGQENVKEVTGDWMNSSGHRANILGRYRKIGCAGYVGAGGRCFWVQCFE